MAIKYFSDQFDDEEMLYLFRKHPVVMRKAINCIGGLLLGTIPALVKPTFEVFFGGLGWDFYLHFLIMFYSWIGWNFSVFIITNVRLIQVTQKGLWTRVSLILGSIRFKP